MKVTLLNHTGRFGSDKPNVVAIAQEGNVRFVGWGHAEALGMVDAPRFKLEDVKTSADTFVENRVNAGYQVVINIEVNLTVEQLKTAIAEVGTEANKAKLAQVVSTASLLGLDGLAGVASLFGVK